MATKGLYWSILGSWVLTFGRAHRKEVDFVASMSWDIEGRRVEGAIVCKILAILPGRHFPKSKVGELADCQTTAPTGRP